MQSLPRGGCACSYVRDPPREVRRRGPRLTRANVYTSPPLRWEAQVVTEIMARVAVAPVPVAGLQEARMRQPGAVLFSPTPRTAAALASSPVKAPDNNGSRSRSSDEKAIG